MELWCDEAAPSITVTKSVWGIILLLLLVAACILVLSHNICLQKQNLKYPESHVHRAQG